MERFSAAVVSCSFGVQCSPTMAKRILFYILVFFGVGRVSAQVQLCLWDDGQIGGYLGNDDDPFGDFSCMTHVDTDTTMWYVWPGATTWDWPEECSPSSPTLVGVVAPYPIAVQDTFTIKHVCNVFGTGWLAERLALANANEQAGIPDQVLDGTEKLLFSVIYSDLCYELDPLVDHVTTRISVDRGATWITAADPDSPFRTEATAGTCSQWNGWHFDEAELAPFQWTGTGYAEYSRHVFDLFQGYRSVWPHYTDPEDYLTAWNTNAVDTVIQQFVLHSDDVSSGNEGWLVSRMFVTSFHTRESGLGVEDTAMSALPQLNYDPGPLLRISSAWVGGRLQVHDATGRMIEHRSLHSVHDIPLIPSGSPGYYFVRLTSIDGRHWSVPFVIP